MFAGRPLTVEFVQSTAPPEVAPPTVKIPLLRRASLVCLLAGLLPVALRLALLPLIPIPAPAYLDEFSYLLGADTFASGRIANPPHPLWVRFETLHVNQQPTYCSKYPPAQALFLAFGQKFLGDPYYGVCLSMGLMFAALCWMLQGWVSPRWALLVTFLGILEWGMTYWMNSYWGGAVAAAGGALVIGAVPRLARRVTALPAVFGSLGLVLLANSRPYEGLLTAIAAAAVLAWWMRRFGRSLAALFTPRAVLPFLCVMVPSIAAMGYYNYRATGSPTLFPYTVNQRTYAASPQLYVLPPMPTPVYRHENIRRFWVEWERSDYLAARVNPLPLIGRSTVCMAGFYFLNALGLAAGLGLVPGAGPVAASALALLALPTLGLLLAKSVLPHYFAPALGAVMILSALGLRASQGWRFRRRSVGRLLVTLCVGLTVGSCISQIGNAVQTARRRPVGIATRGLLIRQLQRQGGRHLIIVRYLPTHPIHSDWVYNRADIDGSDIVWARDMGDAANRDLLEYYRGRKTWLLQPDIDPMALTPYGMPMP